MKINTNFFGEIEIDEKIIVGLSERMKNDNTTIEKIKNLWKNFCNEDGIGEIKNIRDRINKNTVSVYYNYSNENELEYKIQVEKISENLDEEISAVAISWIDEHGLQMLLYKATKN